MTPTFVMAVPWLPTRTRRAVRLAQASDAQVIWDSEHDAFDTFRKVLAAVGEGPAVVLEDDVILAEHWRERVEAAVAEHPDVVIQFFSMRKADSEIGSRWEPGRSFLMNQCYYLPAGAAVELLAYTEDWSTKRPEHPTGYDVAMASWMKDTGQKYWLHVPSLVQHEDWQSMINPRRPRNRQSQTFEEVVDG